MRIFAIHDASGNVSEIVTSPDDLPAPIVTRQGLAMTEIEAPVGVPDSDFEDQDKLAELLDNYRVDVTRPRSPLIPRT